MFAIRVLITCCLLMVIPNAVPSDINFPSYESRATSSNDFNARAAKAAAADLKTLMMALDVYRLDNFHYPSTEQGLAALVWRPVGLPAPKNWNPEGYIKSLPSDPWGTPYGYQNLDGSIVVFSLGSDRKRGGSGFASDLQEISHQ